VRRALITSFLFLSACGKFEAPKDPRTIHGVNPIFVPYINKYLDYKGSPLHIDIPMQFTDLRGDTVGLCTRWSIGWRQIQIDQAFWEYASEGEKFGLVSHEFGHCDLNRNHVLTETSYGWPTSIMYPFVFDVNMYNIVGYMRELFNPGTPLSSQIIETKLDCVEDIVE